MRLAKPHLCAVLEGRATVGRPSHLPHVGVALHSLDAQPRMEALAAAGEVSDELRYCFAEGSLLLRVSLFQSRQNDARMSRVGIERLHAPVQGR